MSAPSQGWCHTERARKAAWHMRVAFGTELWTVCDPWGPEWPHKVILHSRYPWGHSPHLGEEAPCQSPAQACGHDGSHQLEGPRESWKDGFMGQKGYQVTTERRRQRGHGGCTQRQTENRPGLVLGRGRQ